jgi:methionyl-tRNA formyltransferase
MPKSMGAIDWSAGSAAIDRHIRAMQPWPMAYTFLTVPLRAPIRMNILDVDPIASSSSAEPGRVILGEPGELVVRTGDGAVAIRRLQPAGKRAQSTEEFLRGTKVPVDSVFGNMPLA